MIAHIGNPNLACNVSPVIHEGNSALNTLKRGVRKVDDTFRKLTNLWGNLIDLQAKGAYAINNEFSLAKCAGINKSDHFNYSI